MAASRSHGHCYSQGHTLTGCPLAEAATDDAASKHWRDQSTSATACQQHRHAPSPHLKQDGVLAHQHRPGQVAQVLPHAGGRHKLALGAVVLPAERRQRLGPALYPKVLKQHVGVFWRGRRRAHQGLRRQQQVVM
jgi:hypothetical protein